MLYNPHHVLYSLYFQRIRVSIFFSYFHPEGKFFGFFLATTYTIIRIHRYERNLHRYNPPAKMGYSLSRQKLYRGINCPINSTKLLPRNPGPRDNPVDCHGPFKGAKPRHIHILNDEYPYNPSPKPFANICREKTQKGRNSPPDCFPLFALQHKITNNILRRRRKSADPFHPAH